MKRLKKMTDPKKTTGSSEESTDNSLLEVVESQAKMIEDLKAQVAVLTEAVKPVFVSGSKNKLPGEFDPEKPFAKHRGSFGIVLEQDGKHFNLKGEKIKKKKISE